MKSVYIFMHQRKPNVTDLTKQICSAFHGVGISVSAEPWLEALAGSDEFEKREPEACDAIVAVGGDGTLLRANTTAVPRGLPVLGINVGRVGFLAELELDQLKSAVKSIANDDYTINTRMMLKASVGKREMLALNDVVLSRGGYSRLIGINAWVDGDQIGRFIADGVIVATPTGSTGYSLSAGGPIVCPEVACMLLTPICAHSLQHRPVVTSASQTIAIRLDGEHDAMLSIDGMEPSRLGGGETLTVTCAKEQARFIRLKPESFFHTIQYKLSEWSR